MGVQMAEKTRQYTFIVRFSEAESEHFEAFVRESGMKKIAIAKKGIMRFIDENEQKAEN